MDNFSKFVERNLDKDIRRLTTIKFIIRSILYEELNGMKKVANFQNKKIQYFHKLASIYIDISLIDSSSSSMEKDAAWDMALENMARMGKFTKQEMQNLVRQGKIRSDRLFMDDLKRELLKEMDRVGGIVVDGNNPETVEKALHKFFLYIKGGNGKDRINNATDFISKLLNIKDEFGNPIDAYCDNLYGWLKKENLLRDEFLTVKNVGEIPVVVVRKNSHRTTRLDAHNTPKETGTIPTLMKSVNKKLPVNLQFVSNSPDFKVDYSEYANQSINNQQLPSQKSLKGIGIVGIDRNAKQQNLESLAHEVYEATDWNPINLSQSRKNIDNIKDIRNSIDSKMQEKLNDTHRSQVVIAKELGVNHRLFGKDGVGEYNPLRNYRSLQFNKLPLNCNKNYSPIGEHLGLVKTNTPITGKDNNQDNLRFDSIGLNRLFKPKVIGMPDMSYEEFIANAEKVRKDYRIQIMKELGIDLKILDSIE